MKCFRQQRFSKSGRIPSPSRGGIGRGAIGKSPTCKLASKPFAPLPHSPVTHKVSDRFASPPREGAGCASGIRILKNQLLK